MINERHFCDNTRTRNENHNNQYYQEYHHEYQKDHDDDYYYNNNYNIAPVSGRVPTVLLPEEQILIRDTYVDNIGPMTGAAAKLIETALEHGLTASEVVMAIEETGLAPRPSAYYLKAILEAWATNGVTVSKLRRECHANSARKWWK